MIKKHGPYSWLDIWIERKRVRRSLKTTEQGLALEKARDFSTLPFVLTFVSGDEEGLGPVRRERIRGRKTFI